MKNAPRVRCSCSWRIIRDENPQSSVDSLSVVHPPTIGCHTYPVNESTAYESKKSYKRKSEAPDIGRLFDRTPPHHIDAERSLLGSILLDPSMLMDVVQIVSSADVFYKESHGAIFKALLDTYEAHQTGDLVQLAESLRARGVLDQVGGTTYLMELAEAVPSAANAPFYAKLIS